MTIFNEETFSLKSGLQKGPRKLMLFCILDTFLKDNVLILEGEITNWSLLGVKELENAAKMIVGSSCLICVYNTFVV